jgi:hypothetical protein
MTFTPESIVIIIGAVGLAIVNVITAWKVKAIEHSVNSAASASVSREQSYVKEATMLRETIAELKKTAELLAQRAEPLKRKAP